MGDPRVIVVGSVNVDLVVAAQRLPAAGETVTGGDVARHHGGKGGNQAVAAARLGARVSFVGAVGSDDLGAAARAALAAEGIDLAALARVDRPTGVALIVVDPAGENLIAVAPGANSALTPGTVEAALQGLAVGPGDVVLTVCEIPGSAVGAALGAARGAGATSVLNPAPPDGLDAATIALADVLTPNETELLHLTGTADPETGARSLLAAGSGVGSEARVGAREARRFVAVTLGAAGALFVPESGRAVLVPAPAVRPVDTTGAGDAFNGALAAGLAAGIEPLAAVRRAVSAAALSTTRAGARGGMPTVAELEGGLPAG